MVYILLLLLSFIYLLFQMLIELDVLLQDVPLLAAVFFLVIISSLGVPRNNTPFRALALKQNIALWPTLPQNLHG
jgi:hypothetical protein